MIGLHSVLCIIMGTVAALASEAAQLKAELLGALEGVVLEQDARKVIEPYMEDVKKLDAAVIEKIVFKQWWQLAQELIAKSHLQKADLSIAVRNAVRNLKDESDELLRTLNPKYGQAQQVAPAFQWAQNDTCIFFTVKFTVRWNAPGALQVFEPAVIMEGNKFNFTGLGKHSNNKYKYQLALNLFDNVSPAESEWNAASVGKLSVTLRKKWARKWPRLLVDKKTKISNMHVWMETQDRLNGQLGGLATVSHSPATCASIGKFYCSVMDTCKPSGNCTQCPGKTQQDEALGVCAGTPSKRPGISFKDSDMDRDEYGGFIKVTKEKYDFETDRFVVYWGRDSKNKIAGDDALITEVLADGDEASVKISANTKKPQEATHLLVYSKNIYGEGAGPENPQGHYLVDAFLPEQLVKSATFNDDDGTVKSISGELTIEKPEDDGTIDKYVIHWGKSELHRVDKRKNQTSHIVDFDKSNDASHAYTLSGGKVPEQATHLLIYVRNEHGEHPTPVAVKIVDRTGPCRNKDDDDCPTAVTVSPAQAGGFGQVVSVERAKSEADLKAYVLFWGRGACSTYGFNEGAQGFDQLNNGHLKHLAIEDAAKSEDGKSVNYEIPSDLEVPDGTTHILAFSNNHLGDSAQCVSASFASGAASVTTSPEDVTKVHPEL